MLVGKLDQNRPFAWRGGSWVVGSIAIVSAIALLSGCATAAPGPSAREGSLVIAENEPPATFDPVQADNSTVDEVVIPAYETLVEYNEKSEIVGLLASSWEVSADGREISVELEDGPIFHDGTALTANDVKYTLDRIKSIGIGVASYLTSYESSKTVDDRNLTIALSQADAPFIAALTRVYILNSALVEKNVGTDQGQSWLSRNDAGSGPYALTSYSPNQSAEFAEYTDYWRGTNEGQAKSVVFRYLSDPATQAAALKSGDVDIAMDITPIDWATFDGTDGFVVDKADANVVLYVFFNMNDPKTSDPALREAVAYAYDYEQHLTSILKGAGKPVVGPLPSEMQCSTTDLIQPTQDLEKAAEIVADNGLKGTELTMTYLEATSEMEQAATLLQSNLVDIGINLTLQAITYPQYIDLTAADDTRPQLGMIYAFPPFPDTSAIMYQNFNSASIGSQNWGAYKSDEVDKLTNDAQVETDQNVRCDYYVKTQQIVSADFASVNMANSQIVSVMTDRVQGYKYRPAHHQTVDVYSITLK